MSTSPRRDRAVGRARDARKTGGGNTVQPYLEEAEHLGAEFADTLATCRAAVRDGGPLHYLAHYSSAVFDFSVDVLGDPPDPATVLPGASRRDELRRLGRQLSFVVNGIEQTLLEARTGGLIRTVLHTENGAVFCDSVVPRECVVGVALSRSPGDELADMPEVTAADRTVSALVTKLRARVSLPSLNPGGWESAERAEQRSPDGPAGARGYRGAGSARPEPAVPSHLWSAGPDPAPERAVTACAEAVRPDALHFVAYCARGRAELTADQLGDPSLSRFFTQITVDARRRFYRRFAGELGVLAHRLNRTIRGAIGGQLLRFVLDVEQGAVYYYRLGLDDYLAGVTIDQSRVSVADSELFRLAADLRRGLS